MGKTNPTYRDHIANLRENDFRRALRRRFQDSYDECLLMVDDRAHAGGMLHGETVDPHIPALWSVVVTQQRRIAQLEARLDEAVAGDA